MSTTEHSSMGGMPEHIAWAQRKCVEAFAHLHAYGEWSRVELERAFECSGRAATGLIVAWERLCLVEPAEPVGHYRFTVAATRLAQAYNDLDLLDTAILHAQRQSSAPPDRRRPSDPQEGTPIGTIDGLPVLAYYLESGELCDAWVVWRGLRISTDGAEYLNPGLGKGAGCVGDIHLREWSIVRELVRTGIAEQLIVLALAHRWVRVPGREGRR